MASVDRREGPEERKEEICIKRIDSGVGIHRETRGPTKGQLPGVWGKGNQNFCDRNDRK